MITRGLLALSVALAAVAAPVAPAVAAPPAQGAPSVTPQVELTGLDRLLYLTHAGDGTGGLYVVEKAGQIEMVRNGAIHPRRFLDITTKMRSAGSEQ